MPRFTNPYPQFTDSNGNPVLSGTLTFFESGTNTLKTVYADSEENTPIANPMTLAADGSAPNVFYSGAARVKLTNSAGVQIFDRDPVGGESQLGNFSTWGPGFLYGVNDIVKAANGEFYLSLQANNQDNDPTASAGDNQFWENIRFIGIYNAQITYAIGDVVQTTDGIMWRSVLASNAGNNPATDDGTNWLSVYDILTDKKYTSHVVLTGGGALSVSRVNEIQDGSTYTLPDAPSVDAGQWLDVYLPERYRANEPVVEVALGDTITDSNGTDTSVTYNLDSWGLLRFVSDGVSNWSI